MLVLDRCVLRCQIFMTSDPLGASDDEVEQAKKFILVTLHLPDPSHHTPEMWNKTTR